MKIIKGFEDEDIIVSDFGEWIGNNYIDYKSEYKNNRKIIESLLKEIQELKKQLEEWKHHLKCSKEMLNIQGQKGNYDYDEYMLGLYNGMEYIISLFETREPKYINGKEIKFLNNQQKEFINYLESEIECCELVSDSLFNHNKELKVYREVLQKYKEVIDKSDEKKS